MKFRFVVAAAALVAAPALADDAVMASGNAEDGEKVFRQCIACHVVQDDEGELLAGRAGKTGPNLYKIADRPAGSVEGFRYSKGMTEAAEKGLVWTEETAVPYLQDPTGFLREFSGDASARSNMTLKLRKPEDAANVYAYLVSLVEDDD